MTLNPTHPNCGLMFIVEELAKKNGPDQSGSESRFCERDTRSLKSEFPELICQFKY
jgi:hypothetical protein